MLKSNPYLDYRIAACRERLGLCQTELAEHLGTTVDYISAIEKGEKKPRTLMVARLAAALKVSLEYLNRRERYLWNIGGSHESIMDPFIAFSHKHASRFSFQLAFLYSRF